MDAAPDGSVYVSLMDRPGELVRSAVHCPSGRRRRKREQDRPLTAAYGYLVVVSQLCERGWPALVSAPAASPIGLIDTATGRVTRVVSDDVSDYHSMAWLPGGRILALRVGLRSALWKFSRGNR